MRLPELAPAILVGPNLQSSLPHAYTERLAVSPHRDPRCSAPQFTRYDHVVKSNVPMSVQQGKETTDNPCTNCQRGCTCGQVWACDSACVLQSNVHLNAQWNVRTSRGILRPYKLCFSQECNCGSDCTCVVCSGEQTAAAVGDKGGAANAPGSGATRDGTISYKPT